VFVRLLSAVQERSAPDRTLRGWLFGVASRVVSAYYRQKYRVEETELTNTLPARNPNVDTDIHNQLVGEYLRAHIQKLTPEQQEVVALRYSYDIPFREVGEMMGKSEAAVKMLHIRAMKALAQQIGQEINTHGG
jgi:RNA polymerase sigma-70 factor (ECF subfamily)